MPNKTNEEIAADLTKVYFDHINIRIQKDHLHNDLSLESAVNIYKSFLAAVDKGWKH
ncbi:hypothetical protein AKUA1202_04930 [Apilactobacillus kunkeei]|uniref:Uncharacterized protein n=1 Tax=Apilactobacillus kunkeei TaxID=148814 RepID=A0A1L8CFX1_9LACO|nr:hypothetical protein AKUA1802_04820 [Apilactobacillus kunkeei]CAI2581411.1 hypothetical protein AKUA0901_04820 [Apilactobacillus kunkeei]CAI2581785.1 hypothetical protein AKUA1201_04820 [Apilactobacillus kunkeei]CAI2582006.1 hypothetical protein AKUA1002_04820 [Apilactobacillus kunkeei]CAI2614443.1 hypothetical protein AKUH3B103M_09230 [Apilactobacillus kunkeei]